MTLILDGRWRALDSSGNAYVGATLTIYDAGTTTLSSIYRDSGLSTPMTNPTSGADVSDSGGWFPQIFVAEGGSYDITLKTSGGVTVKSYVNVPALGTGTGIITRDFTNSRLRIAGSGGIVRVEAGDPSGDDVGGKITLGGYLGTQADVINLDGAAVGTTGLFTENGKKLPGVIQNSGSFSAATSFIVTLSASPTGITAWDIDFSAAPSTSTPSITTTFSTDNGSTYLSAANYVTNGTGGGTSATLFSGTSSTSQGINARLRHVNGGGLLFPVLFGSVGSPAGQPVHVNNAYATAGTIVTNIKFTASTGNLTGWWRAIPLRATGDA